MNELHQKILDAARDEVDNNRMFMYRDEYGKLKEAALLAMEKQAEFYRWASIGYIWMPSWNHWEHVNGSVKGITELELYEIWEGE